MPRPKYLSMQGILEQCNTCSENDYCAYRGILLGADSIVPGLQYPLPEVPTSTADQYACKYHSSKYIYQVDIKEEE